MPDICAALSSEGAYVFLEAPPGAGKTTTVPLAAAAFASCALGTNSIISGASSEETAPERSKLILLSFSWIFGIFLAAALASAFVFGLAVWSLAV